MSSKESVSAPPFQTSATCSWNGQIATTVWTAFLLGLALGVLDQSQELAATSNDEQRRRRVFCNSEYVRGCLTFLNECNPVRVMLTASSRSLPQSPHAAPMALNGQLRDFLAADKGPDFEILEQTIVHPLLAAVH